MYRETWWQQALAVLGGGALLFVIFLALIVAE